MRNSHDTFREFEIEFSEKGGKKLIFIIIFNPIIILKSRLLKRYLTNYIIFEIN